jgi:mRNA-degrading endonuclease YafQ of YafQ-DinJ toxin-antitoxin module
MQVLQTPTFKRQSKKLHQNQKISLDEAIRNIISNPETGELKKGDLSGVRVYKFKMQKQLTLIAYEFLDTKMELILLALGSHENFYSNLKNK